MSADTVRFIPMNFGESDASTRQFDVSRTFKFAPASASEQSVEPCQISNAAICRDDFDVFNGADQRKINHKMNLILRQEN